MANDAEQMIEVERLQHHPDAELGRVLPQAVHLNPDAGAKDDGDGQGAGIGPQPP
ncbi:MAG TPA: hypothetical protein VGR16_08245 [Thermomicrobiales bacterium]|nr:hypothetical protein [Thermomicrobiales bacterium]